MGFELRRKFILEFDAPALDGLEVTARSTSIDELLGLQDVAVEFDAAETVAAKRAAFARLVDAVASVLLDWNVEVDGVPVPADAEHLAQSDPLVMMSILRAYQAAATQVAGPLDGTSTGGEPSAELSIPMEPSSESLAS